MTDVFGEADKQQMQTEIERAHAVLSAAILEVAAEDADLRYFTFAMVGAVLELFAEVEGPENLANAVARLGAREVAMHGVAGTC